jgi:outer membrane protein assembly factor BamB
MKALFVVVSFAMLLGLSTWAENWPHWRGPFFNGSTTESNLPATFSQTENVKWTTMLPGISAATPIIWGDRVFVSSGDEQTKSMHALALDRQSGKILWNHEVGTGYSHSPESNFASPSPATDGKLVVYLYGNGELVAFDLAGNKFWNRNLQTDYGAFAYQWTYGSSPTLYEGKLYLQVLQRNEPVHGRGRTDGPIDSFLLAIEPQTGKTIWKYNRPTEAHLEAHEAYSTPIPFTYNGRTELLVTGGDCITGHSLEDGHEFWRWGTWNPTRIGHWRLVPSAVAGEGIVLASAPKGSPVYAFKAGAQAKDDSVLAWKSEDREVSSDVGTPLFYKGRFYVLNGDRGVISRVVPASGKVEWVGELGRRTKIESSPTCADDKIYFQNFHGEVFVVAAADQFKLLNIASMGDPEEDRLRSSIAISQGNLFIRTGHKLYCIGK